jgi:hypothetical protein
MPVLEKRHHTAAVIAKLAAAGLDVGDGVAPGGDTPPEKYVVVYPLPGGSREGTLAGPWDDAELVYQLTCVGITRLQAEWVRDKAEAAMLTGLTVTGRNIALVRPDEGDSGTYRDDTQTPPLYYATPRYRIYTTPAA